MGGSCLPARANNKKHIFTRGTCVIHVIYLIYLIHYVVVWAIGVTEMGNNMLFPEINKCYCSVDTSLDISIIALMPTKCKTLMIVQIIRMSYRDII